MDDFDDIDDMNPYSSTLTVTYDGKEDAVHYRPGDNPATQIQNHIIELHSFMLAVWLFYGFAVILVGAIAGMQLGPFFGLVAFASALGLTVKYVLRKNSQTFGLISEWQTTLTGAPKPKTSPPATNRLGPPEEWIN